jgi:GT2 family glycosyltransferase
MNMNMIDLSIIIVSWNTREVLRECLESVLHHTSGITFEVFVVDNNSSDGSAEMVHDVFPAVHLIANKENAGFSKANNQAIRISGGRYVALLNPDTLLLYDVFSPLVRYADQHKKIGAIGPKVLFRDGKTIQKACARRLPNLYFDFCRLSGLSRKFFGTRLFGGEYLSYWDHLTSRYVEGLLGACMIVSRKAISDVGLMDERQFMYGDEIDWCKRLLDAGWRIYYYADASIIHYGGESSKQVKLSLAIEAEKAMLYYYRKHKGGWYANLYVMQVFLASFSKYAWRLCMRRKNNRIEELIILHKSMFMWSLKQLLSREV